MKAKVKSQRKPKAKKENNEPKIPIPELTYNDIVKECERSWKAIDNTTTFDEYKATWAEYDKYKLMKDNYKK